MSDRLVSALLAAREREIQNPRDEANRVAGRKAKQALARELGGEEHIPCVVSVTKLDALVQVSDTEVSSRLCGLLRPPSRLPRPRTPGPKSSSDLSQSHLTRGKMGLRCALHADPPAHPFARRCRAPTGRARPDHGRRDR